MKERDFNKLLNEHKNIIFDFGGVFIDIDYHLTIEAFQKISNANVDSLYSKKEQVEIFDLLETGKIGEREFIDSLGKILKVESSYDEIKKAWNAMLLEIHPERVEYLRRISKNKRIFMLSNINEIHEAYMVDYFEKNKEFGDFYSLFEKVYFSHNIGLRKPNKEAFSHVLEQNNLKIEDTLFLDDSPQHVEGFSKMGGTAVHLDPPNSFIAKF